MVKKESGGYVKTPMTMVPEETMAATNGPLVFSIRQRQSTGGNGTFLPPLTRLPTSPGENKSTYRQARCLCKKLAYVYRAVYLSMYLSLGVAGSGTKKEMSRREFVRLSVGGVGTAESGCGNACECVQ